MSRLHSIVFVSLVALASLLATQGVLAHRATDERRDTLLHKTNQADWSIQNTTAITPGVLSLHERDADIAYNWFSYIPESLSKSERSYILATGFNANVIEDYHEMTEISRGEAEYRIQFAEQHHYTLLVPVIPRPASTDVYAIAFDWRVFLDSTDAFLQRPDQKLNRMIDQLVSDLQSDGYNVDTKVFVEGFSAGGMFAQKYAMLHPARVKAIAAGQCGGWITLPESAFDSTAMDWPVGIHDFTSLTGYEFEQVSYRQLPQFIYIGDEDTLNSHVYPGSSWQSTSQIDFLNTTFGYTDPIRLENQAAFLHGLDYDSITFHNYPGIGHEHLSQVLIDAVFAFFDDVRRPNRVFLPVVARELP